MEAHLTDVTRVIQLAVAPVFLLTSVAAIIGALNTRLGRIVDRRRVLQERLRGCAEADERDYRAELLVLSSRIRITYFSIFAAVLSALLVCLVVAAAFVGALVGVDLYKTVAVLFILAMGSLVACLGMFLREVFLAVASKGHDRR
jgi:hypothetical protein